jgi:hypothetical protein
MAVLHQKISKFYIYRPIALVTIIAVHKAKLANDIEGVNERATCVSMYKTIGKTEKIFLSMRVK